MTRNKEFQRCVHLLRKAQAGERPGQRRINDGARKGGITTQICPECAAEGHDPDASLCKYYGSRL